MRNYCDANIFEMEKIVKEVVMHLDANFKRAANDIISSMLGWNSPNYLVKESNEGKPSYFRNHTRPKRQQRCYSCGGYGHISPGCFKEGTLTNESIQLSRVNVETKNEREWRKSPQQESDEIPLLDKMDKFQQQLELFAEKHVSLTAALERANEKNCKLEAEINEIQEKYAESKRKCSLIDHLERENEVPLVKSLQSKVETSPVIQVNLNETFMVNRSVQTIVRVKPGKDTECCEWKQNPAGDVFTLLPKHKVSTEYKCGYICGPNDSNEDVFSKIEPLLEMTMSGTNTCIVAHGGSGSGKSHTMIGDAHEQGVIPRTVDYLIRNSKSQINGFSMQLSIYEIYNEMIIDRLCKRLNRDDSRTLSKRSIESVADFQRHFKFAKRRRKTARTLRNPEASRSHMVIKVFLKGEWRDSNRHLESSITMIDSAGYECAKDHLKNARTSTRIYEMLQINKSNSELAAIIEKWKNQLNRLDFQNSKLAYVIKPFFSTDTRMLIIATVTEEIRFLSATMETLRVVDTANRVEQKFKGPEGVLRT